jgi:hypothetical protein
VPHPETEYSQGLLQKMQRRAVGPALLVAPLFERSVVNNPIVVRQ